MFFSTIYVTQLPPPLFLGQLTGPIPVPALRGHSLQTLLLSDTPWRDVPPASLTSFSSWKVSIWQLVKDFLRKTVHFVVGVM